VTGWEGHDREDGVTQDSDVNRESGLTARGRRARGAQRLDGKVAVVTGAARGLGAALALRLAQRGAQVALVGLEAAELENAAADCAPYAPARAWVADVTDHDRMRAVADEIAGHYPQVDIVVANAGIAAGGLFSDTDPAVFGRVIEVNLLGSVTTARVFLPVLTASGGYFLQVASLAALAHSPLMAAYCASKAGVEAFAHSLRAEVAHQGVGVGIAYLTWTDTDMVRATDEDSVLKEMRSRLPWPASRTAPLAPAADRIVAGIARRSAHIYAQRWLYLPAWLPRTALPSMIGRQGPRDVARVESELRATGHLRGYPVGPGGLAAWQTDGAGGRPAEEPADQPGDSAVDQPGEAAR
jgi:NAD(P)-dependent dehydrogenase (short-subunit alcohol dehydrogenase family)